MRHALDNAEPSAPRPCRWPICEVTHARLNWNDAGFEYGRPSPAPPAADWLMPRLPSHDAEQL
jgi:hypothetical protein